MKPIAILVTVLFITACGGEEGPTTPQKPFCGDGVCNTSETCNSCSEDCGLCAPFCGDGVCNGGETCDKCSQDCGQCQPQCVDAGGTCDSNNPFLQCCTGSLCVHNVNTPWISSCADLCTYNWECYSGCCAPLTNVSYSVCSDASYCY